MEVQNHGNMFEDKVIQAVTGKTKSEYQKLIEGAYTSAMDIFKNVFSDIDRSIKVCKDGKGIGCGDMLRFMYHCKNTEFIITVGCWKQISSTHKRYYEIYDFYMSPEHYQTIWGGLTEEVVRDFVEYVKGIPEGKAAQLANRQLWKAKRQSLYDQYNKGLAAIDAKIDSKTQRRVQCSLKLEEMIAVGIPYHKYTTEYLGIQLPYEQESSPRTFARS